MYVTKNKHDINDMERMTCIVKNPSYRVSQGRLRPSFLPLRRLGTLLKFPRLRTKPSQKTFNFLVLSTHSLVLLAIRLVAFLDSNSFFSRLWSLFPPKGSRSKCVESSRAISMSLSLLLRALSAGAPGNPPRRDGQAADCNYSHCDVQKFKPTALRMAKT